MQTNVRLPPDTLAGASQSVEQTTLVLASHSLSEPYIHEKKKKRTGEWYSLPSYSKNPAVLIEMVFSGILGYLLGS